MDFDEPLPRVGGYVIYSVLLDYFDTFVHQYTEQNNGQYPSLRLTTDMLLNLFNDIKGVEFPANNSSSSSAEFLNTFEQILYNSSMKSDKDMFNSRNVGLFVDEPKQAIPEEPLKPFKISNKIDSDWLRSAGIKPE